VDKGQGDHHRFKLEEHSEQELRSGEALFPVALCIFGSITIRSVCCHTLPKGRTKEFQLVPPFPDATTGKPRWKTTPGRQLKSSFYLNLIKPLLYSWRGYRNFLLESHSLQSVIVRECGFQVHQTLRKPAVLRPPPPPPSSVHDNPPRPDSSLGLDSTAGGRRF
jgi:hypothetical protein